MSMYCYQCEQTAQGSGCKAQGVCGKDSTSAELQDKIIQQLKELSKYAHRVRSLSFSDKEINIATIEGLFSTVTNVNFDSIRLKEILDKLIQLKEKAKNLYNEACKLKDITPELLVNQDEKYSILDRQNRLGEDITSLQEILLYGLKGMAAYADHAMILGQEDEKVYAFFHEALDFLTKENPTIAELVAMSLKCGEVNLTVMGMLDAANTSTYGHPEPTAVRTEPIKGISILVSGHDLKDLAELLKQTNGLGINVYTHGEMLPAHAYPEIKKYNHLIGNYGGAWQDQQKEFEEFPGAILMTTNCIQRPRENYKNRIFTSGLVAWPDVTHISDGNFAPVIEAALRSDGYIQDGPDNKIMVGFGHNAVINVADKVIEAVKSGAIKHFFLIGGCDGAKSGRNYYTELAQSIPNDSVILTLACGKYRFNKLEFGDINGIPRLLDIGQCNDAYSAIQIAVALAKAFGTDVNGLPLSMILSWYEQKAVAILLTLLHLGIKNIRLGPTLPAFISPTVLNVLVENFNIMPITTAENDLNAILSPV